MRKVIVIGGGASGMMAAIAAARHGAEVHILERMDRVGKKLLATGNGRCNLSNAYINIERFHGRNPEFIYGAINGFNLDATIDFFEDIGIKCRQEDGGKIFPYSGQASSVLDVLRYEMERLEIKEHTSCEVIKVQPDGKGFNVITKSGEIFKADRVILCAGGKASPNLGSNGSGYKVAEALGHRLITPIPSLVQLRLNGSFLRAVKGVKFIGTAVVGYKDKILRKEDGEILFTEYGISGPPILQLSRFGVSGLEEGKKPWIQVDMFPEFTDDELKDIIKKRIDIRPEKPIDFTFIGLINKKLIIPVLREAGIDDIHKVSNMITEDEIDAVAEILKGWKMEVIGSQSWTEAQVTAGGIDVKDVDAKTMESKIIKGLYMTGEILDIDGDCGGFNLQWAWSSGYIAGKNASK